MAIESLLVPAATGALGIAMGFGAALIARHKAKEIPKAVDKDVWEHLRELTRERAEAAAKKKALKRTYAAGAMNEHSFITKDAHYTKLAEELDKDIDKTVQEISKTFLPAELQKGEKELQELSDLVVLSKQIEELKHEKKELDDEKNSLYLQMTEMEEDKQMQLSEKNRLRERYEKDSAQLQEMSESITQLEKHREELEKKVSGIKPRDQKITTLEKENRMLRKGLSNARQKITKSDKAMGILSAIIDKNSQKIDEGKKKDELKELIQPNNLGVKGLVQKHSTPEAIFAFVRDEILEVHPQVSASYWLSVDDIIRLGAGDPHDKAVLLCSMLRAIGKESVVAVLEMKNGYQRAVVSIDDHVLDPAETREFTDYTGLSEEEALNKYMFDGFNVKKVLYRFNEAMYRDS